MTSDIIREKSKVVLHFSLALENGEVIDSNYDSEPVEMVIGDGNMLPGFEAELLGCIADQEKEVKIISENAFGVHNKDNIQYFTQNVFSDDCDLQEGIVIAFTDKSGSEVPGVVKKVSDEKVEVDFNHPLAGKDIYFKFKIHSVNSEN